MDKIQREDNEASREHKRRREALLAEYGEICDNFRMLTDIRFKLLAFLPIASAATIVAAMGRDVPGEIGITIGFALSLFGFVTTIGIATYNARNDQLYDELVSRAAAIERGLDVPDGAFATRPATRQRIRVIWANWKIDHRKAVSTIYGASIALWLFGVVAFGLEGCCISLVARFPSVSTEGASTWMILLAGTLSTVITYSFSWWIKRKKEVREEALNCCARDAMKAAMDLVPEPKDSREFIHDCATDETFLQTCIDLATCAKLSDSSKDSKEKGRIAYQVRRRAKFYAKLDAQHLGFYLTTESSKLSKESAKLSASHLIGLLTDSSPLWIFDCGTNRKGDLPETRPQ